MRPCFRGWFLLIAMVVAFGCASSSIYQVNQDQLSKLEPRKTTLDEFRTLFPKATLRAQNVISGHRVDAYGLEHQRMNSAGYEYTEYLWFYFTDQTLLKWGGPGDWPAEPDVIIEKRLR